MGKFSDFIRAPGTAGPPTREGISALGFITVSDIPTVLARFLRLDIAQTFTGPEKTRGRANLGVVIGTDVQAYDAALQSLAALTTSANKMIYTTAPDVYAITDITAFARTILDDTNAGAVRTTIGAAIGTDVQAYDAGLQSIAGLTTAPDKMIYTTALDVYAIADLSPFARTILDDTSASAVRTTIGLGNVDNTSDANKPVSTAQAAAIAGATGAGAIRAWANFNGTGTVAIRASGNVSSITDFGTGDYGVNFTTAMVDANYGFVLSSNLAGPAYQNPSFAPTASALRIVTVNAAGSGTDASIASITVVR